MSAERQESFFKTAFLLSVALHILFVTAAEAGMIFSKPEILAPIFTFAPRTSAIESKVPAPQTPPVKAMTLKEQLSQLFPKPKPVAEPKVKQTIQKFKTEQNRLDKRISSIKQDIIKKQVELLRSVSSSVYDLEKVPAQARKSILPEYLKTMRSQISARWLVLLEAVGCDSCVAIVEYRIDRTGKISEVKLLQSSQNKAFDTACLEAVAESSPLSALPFDFATETKDNYLTVSLTFYLEQGNPKKISL